MLEKVLKKSYLIYSLSCINCLTFSSSTTSTPNKPYATPVFCWEVSSKTATVYLCGSIHLGKKEWYPLPSVIEKAFEASSTLAVEVDSKDFSLKDYLLLKLYRVANVLTFDLFFHLLRTYLCLCIPSKWKRLLAYALLHPMGAQDFISLAKILKSVNTVWWGRLIYYVLYIIFPSLSNANIKAKIVFNGYSPTYGLERHFLNAAKQSKKTAISLETIQDQLLLLLRVLLLRQSNTLEQVLKEKEDFASLISAWQKGDKDSFLKAADDIDSRMYGENKTYYCKIMFTDRNKAMVKKINNMLKGDKTVFVLVGALHLVGENGILALLEKQGWKIRQLVESAIYPHAIYFDQKASANSPALAESQASRNFF